MKKQNACRNQAFIYKLPVQVDQTKKIPASLFQGTKRERQAHITMVQLAIEWNSPAAYGYPQQ